MRLLLLAPGTRGDAAPAAGLGSAFVGDGHEVTVVANTEYADLVHKAGCTLSPIDATLDITAQPQASSAAPSGVRGYLAMLRAYMDTAATAALSAASAAPVDAVVTNTISPYGHDIAEALDVPSAAALLQPSFPSSDYPPMIAGGPDLGGLGNRLAGRLAGRVRTPYDPACARVRSELGLPAEARAKAQRRRLRSGMAVHHGISPAVLPRPADWPTNLSLDGFWWPPATPEWQPPADLTDFLVAGPPPLLVTLGSLPPEPEVTRAISRAIQATETHVVLQGSQFDELATQLGGRALLLGAVPHEWLLPRCAAVLHHAGAGVTSAALRAGTPSVTVPMHTDQPFWARRLVALSAGSRPLAAKKVTAEALAPLLQEAMTSPALRAGAEAMRDTLRDEDGTRALRRWLNDLA